LLRSRQYLARMRDTRPSPAEDPTQVSGVAAGSAGARHPLDAREQRFRGFALEVALRAIQAGPLVVLLLILGLFAFLSPYFLTQGNLTNILIQSSSVALLALGALVVVMVGSLDLSLGSIVGFCTIVAAVLFRDHPGLGWLIIPMVLAAGVVIGAANAFVVVTLQFGNAFIVTLGTLYMVQSLSFVLSGGSQVHGVPEQLLALANEDLLGIPGPIALVLAAGTALSLFLSMVAWGRWIVAIGGNAEGARKVGIPVRRVLFSVYVIAGLFAAIAGLLVAGRNDAGIVDSGTSILLAIAAVVIGGTTLTGGRGSVWATIVGAVILGSITNGLTLVSVSPNWTPFAVGAVLVVAVGLDGLRGHVEGRLRVRQSQNQAGLRR